MTITWDTLISCFSYSYPALNPNEFYLKEFDPALLQSAVDIRFGAGTVTIPAEWATTGYADMVETYRYARTIAGLLGARGVKVIGMPSAPPVSERFFNANRGVPCPPSESSRQRLAPPGA